VLCIDEENVQALLPEGHAPLRHLRSIAAGRLPGHRHRPRGAVVDVHREEARRPRWAVEGEPHRRPQRPERHRGDRGRRRLEIRSPRRPPRWARSRACSGASRTGAKAQVTGADGSTGRVLVIDDYGHHPAEIKATLAARATPTPAPRRRAVQPHRYTRTAALKDDFRPRLQRRRRRARRPRVRRRRGAIPGATGEGIAEAIAKHGHHDARAVGSLDEGAAALAALARPGDIVFTLGAGDVTHVARSSSTGSAVRSRRRPLLLRRMTKRERRAPPRLERRRRRGCGARRHRAGARAVLARRTTFGIGGPADLSWSPGGGDVVRALQIARDHAVPVFVLGGGSNLLWATAHPRARCSRCRRPRLAAGPRGRRRHPRRRRRDLPAPHRTAARPRLAARGR